MASGHQGLSEISIQCLRFKRPGDCSGTVSAAPLPASGQIFMKSVAAMWLAGFPRCMGAEARRGGGSLERIF
jgi:hypothetical protein